MTNYALRGWHAESIYFIQCNGQSGPVKIGRTTHLDARLVSMQTNNPYPLLALYAFEGHGGDERALLSAFRPYRLRGEWFQPEPVLAYLEQFNWREWAWTRLEVIAECSDDEGGVDETFNYLLTNLQGEPTFPSHVQLTSHSAAPLAANRQASALDFPTIAPK